MFQLDKTPGRKCILDKKEFLFFSGYSYLGMNYVKAFTRLVKKGMAAYGVLYPSSRISNTRLKLYERFEKRLSVITGMEDTVSFSSGYLAGKTIADILSSSRNIATSPATHPAINIPSTIKTIAIDFDEWKDEITGLINKSFEKEFVLLADSVDILKAKIHDFSFAENIIPSKKIIFLIDDSHGIGITGKNGNGIISQLPKRRNISYIICYSLSKAFSIEAGAVSCSGEWSEKLRQHPNYTGSTAVNPALVYAFLNSRKLYLGQRKKLLKNIERFKKSAAPNVKQHPFELPVFIYENENAEYMFYKKGIIISSFGYPYTTSKKINRIVISALHTKKDIQKLWACCNEI